MPHTKPTCCAGGKDCSWFWVANTYKLVKLLSLFLLEKGSGKKTAAHSRTTSFLSIENTWSIYWTVKFSKRWGHHLISHFACRNLPPPPTKKGEGYELFFSPPSFAATEAVRRSSLSRRDEPWRYVVLYQGWPTFHDLHDKKDMRRPSHTPFFVPKRDKVDDKVQDDHNFLWVWRAFCRSVFTWLVEGCYKWEKDGKRIPTNLKKCW